MNEIKELIKKYEELLPVGSSVSYTEAERRAGEFLSAMAHITNYKHEIGKDKIKLTTLQTAVYAKKMSEGTAKTVTENKLIAEASAEYVEAREALEDVDNDLSYLRAYYEIFQNGHLFYRQMAKGDNG